MIICRSKGVRNGREGSCHGLGVEISGQNPEAGDFFFQRQVQLVL